MSPLKNVIVLLFKIQKLEKCLKSKPLPKISFPPTDRCVIIIK